MFNNLDIRIIDEPKNVYFPLKRKVLFEKISSNILPIGFLPGDKIFVLILNTLTLERYTISTSVLCSPADNSIFYFFNRIGKEKEIQTSYKSLYDSLILNKKSSLKGNDVMFFWDEQSCYKYLLKEGIPKILKDSENYFTKKDRNLSHDKFEYKKTFYKRAKSAKKELEKYFKNNI